VDTVHNRQADRARAGKKKKYDLKYVGEQHVPYKGPFILVSNHQTGVDVFAEGLAIRKVLSRSRMLPWAKVEIKHGSEGLLGRILWYWLGTIPIDRDATDEAPKAIRKSLDYLRKGKIIFVHPEGTRFPRASSGRSCTVWRTWRARCPARCCQSESGGGSTPMGAYR